MRSISLGLAAAALTFGVAAAQTPNTPAADMAAPTAPATTTAVPPPGMGHAVAEHPNTAAPVTPMTDTSAPQMRHDRSNSAVNTGSVHAEMPASGANSFTQGQARTRIAKHGYSHVSSLKKDKDGVWHGTAQRNGQTVPVWLDYRGEVGQQ